MRSTEPVKNMFIKLVGEVSKRNLYLYHNDYHNARRKASAADAITDCIKICHARVETVFHTTHNEYVEIMILYMNGKKVMEWKEECISEYIKAMA